MLSKARLRFGLLSVGHLRKKVTQLANERPGHDNEEESEDYKNETHSSCKNSGQWKEVTLVIEFSFNRNDSRLCIFYSIPQKQGWDFREKGFSTISSETVFQLRDKKKMRKVKLNRHLKCVGVLIVLGSLRVLGR